MQPGAVSFQAAGSGTSSVVGPSPTQIVSKAANYTAVSHDLVLADATSAAFTVTLPAVAAGAWVTVKKVDSSINAVTVTPASGTIDGASSILIRSQYNSFDLVSDGTNWWVV